MNRTARHLPFIDDLRGLAILAVFVFHALGVAFGADKLPWLNWGRGWNVEKSFLAVFPAQWGWAGVAAFFVVSGFCIHLNHRHWQEKGWKAFALRRFFRIYPPYFVALVIFRSVLLIRTGLIGMHEGGWTGFTDAGYQMVAHVFLVHNFDAHFYYRINPVFWSIAIEVQLYVLYPVLLLIATRYGWGRALAITAVIELSLRGIQSGLAIFSAESELPYFISGSPFFYWFSWTIGAALAEAWLEGDKLPFRNGWGWIWPLLFIVSFFFRPLYDGFSFTFAALATVSLMANLLGRRPTASPSVLQEHISSTGLVSYSAYLIHFPLLSLVPMALARVSSHPVPHLFVFALCLLAWFPIYALSCFLYEYVEQPSIAWGKRVIARLNPKPPVSLF